MRSTVFAMSLLIVSGCNLAEQSKAKAIVKETLVDPASAKFENIVTSGEVTCGWVNSKNRIGGFVGAQRFMVKDQFDVFMDSSASAVESGEMSKWYREFLDCVSDNEAAQARNTREFFRDVGEISDELKR
jgi:hypothetical protein